MVVHLHLSFEIYIYIYILLTDGVSVSAHWARVISTARVETGKSPVVPMR